MGRMWYEDGKLLKKKNTFTDFVACIKHVIQQVRKMCDCVNCTYYYFRNIQAHPNSP